VFACSVALRAALATARAANSAQGFVRQCRGVRPRHETLSRV